MVISALSPSLVSKSGKRVLLPMTTGPSFILKIPRSSPNTACRKSTPHGALVAYLHTFTVSIPHCNFMPDDNHCANYRLNRNRRSSRSYQRSNSCAILRHGAQTYYKHHYDRAFRPTTPPLQHPNTPTTVSIAWYGLRNQVMKLELTSL